MVTAFASNPHLRAVAEIETYAGGSEFGGKRYIQLLKSPYLGNLKRFDIFADVIGLAGVKALIAAPAPFKLETLRLAGSIQVTDEEETKATVDAVKLIASAERFASLKELELPFNGLDAQSIEALLASKTLSPDLSLDLTENPYDKKRYSRLLVERFGSVLE
jgi:hypothetical protein